MRFEKGNTLSTGRGSRTRLTARIFEDVLSHWCEPVPGRNITQGLAALEVMRRERPAEYVKVVTSLLPREMILSDPTVADLSDEQIDTMIVTMRQQLFPSAATADETIN